MLCQQLRIFFFMAVAMVRLSAAAHFDCDDARGYIFCDISLNPGNNFKFSEEDEAVDCTYNSKYYARMESILNDSTKWKIVVLNNGGGTSSFCYGVCSVQVRCDNPNGDCYDACQADVC